MIEVRICLANEGLEFAAVDATVLRICSEARNWKTWLESVQGDGVWRCETRHPPNKNLVAAEFQTATPSVNN